MATPKAAIDKSLIQAEEEILTHWGKFDKPLVSINCITYNHEKFIKDALESFLIQKTDFPFEILVHDDASIDRTQDIVREFEEKYPLLIKPIYQTENQYSKGIKISATFNFPRAKGKYIALCEGDDYWTDPDKLQKQVTFLDTHPDYVGCFHDTMLRSRNQKKLWRQYDRVDFNLLDTFSTVALFHTSSFLFRYQSLELPDWFKKVVVSGDMAIFSLVASKGPLKRLPEVMSVYRKHEGGITNNKKLIENYHQGRIYLMQCLDEYFKGKYSYAIAIVIEFHKQACGLSTIKKQILWHKLKKCFLSLPKRLLRLLN